MITQLFLIDFFATECRVIKLNISPMGNQKELSLNALMAIKKPYISNPEGNANNASFGSS